VVPGSARLADHLPRRFSSYDLAKSRQGPTIVSSTRELAVTAWTKRPQAASRAAVGTYRQALAEQRPVQRPTPQQDCSQTFGNTSIFAGVYDHPAP